VVIAPITNGFTGKAPNPGALGFGKAAFAAGASLRVPAAADGAAALASIPAATRSLALYSTEPRSHEEHEALLSILTPPPNPS
jgi:hypothetical protein